MDHELRRATLLLAAVEVVRADGLEGLTHPALAAQAEASVRTVYRQFSTLADLRRALRIYAATHSLFDVLEIYRLARL